MTTQPITKEQIDKVYAVYQKMLDTWTTDQLSVITTLLVQDSYKRELEQVELKEKIKLESYRERTAWKREGK